MKKAILVSVLFVTLGSLHRVLALGKADAPEGGTMYLTIKNEPPTLNAFASRVDAVGSMINEHVFDTLLIRDPETYEFKPALAESYEVSKDGLSYTFKLRKDAKFSNGQSVTIEDVKFSFEAIRDPKYKAVELWPYYESIKSATVLDPQTIRFDVKEKYFQNLANIGGLWVLPKSYYEKVDAKQNRETLGSGPYTIQEFKPGRQIVLKKNKNWWGREVPYYKGFYKPDQIVYRVIKNENSSLETLKKGELDYLDLSPEQFVLKTQGAPWGAKIFKEEVQNSSPQSQGFIGFNLKNPLFADRNVRLALAHLLDRETIIKKFFFDKSVPATGPWYRDNPAADQNRKPIAFDFKKARELLAAAGWKDEDKNGVLEKIIGSEKKEFRFTLLNSNPDREKIFTAYKETLKQAGIDMAITNADWNAFTRKLDDRSFEAVVMAWTGQVNADPKQVWHSASSVAGGSNFIAYSNKKVDELIDKARLELDDQKRYALLKQVYNLIADDVPYIFLVNTKSKFYGYSDRVGREKPTYKYDIGTSFWWVKTP